MKPKYLLSAALAFAVACSGGNNRVKDDPGAFEETVSLGRPASPPALKLVEASSEEGSVPLLEIMNDEVSRAMSELGDEEEPPYYIAVQVTDDESRSVSGANGAFHDRSEDQSRTVDVDVRVGSPELDNTHELRGQWRGDYEDWHESLAPWDDDRAIRRAVWRMTEDRYRKAASRFLEVKANQGVRAEEEDPAADFSTEPAVEHIEPLAEPSAEIEVWAERVERLSTIPEGAVRLENLVVSFDESILTRYQVTTEGSRVRKVRHKAQLSWWASAQADDGMNVWLFDSIDLYDPAGFPDEDEVRERIEGLVELVLQLREAPLAEPYVGPAILEGEAAGVFFHEALGHRVEGHRQSDEDEGQTFARKLGEPVLPTFLSVFDDPRARRLGETDLMGHYLVDDQAVQAQRASIVENGILTGFLMSRDPTRSFEQSNGHGRREPGKHVVARQGNLVIQPSTVVGRDELESLLLEAVKRQGVDYGLRIVRVRGGYTLTTRGIPQSFRILPQLVYRVYPDGREELIRGMNFDGTPLTVLSEITAAADDWGVFNGVCGAESGHVPVSSVSPTLLVRRVETTRASKSADRPPILGPPGEGGDQ
jgi:predicted Zn-dependent protease